MSEPLTAETTTRDHLRGLIDATIAAAEHGSALTKNTADDKIAATLKGIVANGGLLLEYALDYVAKWIDKLNAGEDLVLGVEELPADVQALNLPDPTEICTALQAVLKLFELVRGWFGR